MNDNFTTPPDGADNEPRGEVFTEEKAYDPYNDGVSLSSEILAENKGAFLGAAPLHYETPQTYGQRMLSERSLAKTKAAEKLRSVSGYLALTLMLFLFMREGLSMPLSLLAGAIPDKVYTILTDIFLILQYVAIALPIIIMMTFGKKNKALTYFKRPEASGWFIARWSLIAFAVTHITAIAFDVFFQALEQTGVHINDLSSPLPSGVTENILYFIAVVICAPIFEELLFRGILLTPLTRFGGWFAVSVTAVLFGLFHMNHAQIFFAMAFGFALGYADLKARSIIPSVIAHAAFNGFSFISGIVASFTNYEEYIENPEVILTGSPVALALFGIIEALTLALMIAGSALIIYEFAINKGKLELPRGSGILTVKEKLAAVFSHPLMIVYLIIVFGYIMLVSFVDVAGIAAELDKIMQAYAEVAP